MEEVQRLGSEIKAVTEEKRGLGSEIKAVTEEKRGLAEALVRSKDENARLREEIARLGPYQAAFEVGPQILQKYLLRKLSRARR